MQPRDDRILEHIADYCDDIQDAVDLIESSYERFISDKQSQYSIAFSIMQIGELVGKLSEELRASTKQEIDWPAVKGMRNIIVHDYGEVRLSVVWNVATLDIPPLKAFCEKHLS